LEVEVPKELCDLLAQLEVVSQVSASQLGASRNGSEEDIGGKRPPGGEEYWRWWHADDADYPQKSLRYFRKRIERVRDPATFQDIIVEARAALEACRRAPAPSEEPEYGTPQWKRWVAESEEPPAKLAYRFNVSRQYIEKVRANYSASHPIGNL
jgi:hypothetical protein